MNRHESANTTTARHGGALALACAAALVGCMPPPAPPAGAGPGAGGYDGATRSIGAMVASPNRCQFTFLYDTFVTQRLESGQTSPAMPNSRDAVLRAPQHVAGGAVTVVVKGAASGDAGPIGTLSVDYGATHSTTELRLDSNGSQPIQSELTARAGAGDNPVKVTVTLASPLTGQKQQQVDIDSMDVALDGDFCKSLPK